MGGQGVGWEELPAGMNASEICSDKVLIGIIASGNAAELRRCRRCRDWLERGEYDRNARGRLLLACRMCLVSKVYCGTECRSEM